MKKILLILFCSFSTLAFGNYIGKSYVGVCQYGIVTHNNYLRCLAANSDGCIEINAEYNCHYSVLGPTYSNDYDRPMYWTKHQAVACSGQADCESKQEALTCEDVQEQTYIDADYTEAYCSRYTWHQIEAPNTTFKTDPVKKAKYDHIQEQKALVAQILSKARVKRNCAVSALDQLYGQKDLGSMTNEQREAFATKAQGLINEISAADLVNVKNQLTSTETDDVVFTESDKTFSIEKINQCIAL